MKYNDGNKAAKDNQEEKVYIKLKIRYMKFVVTSK